MKLLITTENLLPWRDGISRFLDEIIPRLAKNYEVTVVAPKFPGNAPAYEGVKIISIPLLGFRLANYPPARPAPFQVFKLVSESDLVFNQSTGLIGMCAVLAARLQHKPVISYIHVIEWEHFTRAMGTRGIKRRLFASFIKFACRIFYNNCTLLLMPSLEIAELYGLEGIKTQKKVLHLATNTDEFKPAINKAEAKRLVGIAEDRLVIGFTGRISREKDLLTLHRAFLRIRKSHNPLLLIVGSGVKELERVFRSKPDIMYVGSVDDVPKYLRAMDIYVMPSLTETNSLATMEAMACGVPVISTPVGFLKDYIRHGYNGYFFPRRDSYALSKRLSELLGNPQVRKAMSENARRTIVERFSWDRTAEELMQAINLYDVAKQEEPAQQQ